MNERPIPEAALADEDSVEMLRVWIAAKGLHCSLKVGMYKEGKTSLEENAWGTILADVARHIAAALEDGYGVDPEESLRLIRAKFDAELGASPPRMTGGFVQKQ